MLGVLIDTSVWVDHFRYGNDGLIKLIHLDLALTHPMIVTELACGTPPEPRLKTLNNIRLLQACTQASVSEVLDFIENEKIYGLGCGLVDISLLVSTILTPNAQLWTLDKRLAELAKRFGVEYQIALH